MSQNWEKPKKNQKRSRSPQENKEEIPKENRKAHINRPVFIVKGNSPKSLKLLGMGKLSIDSGPREAHLSVRANPEEKGLSSLANLGNDSPFSDKFMTQRDLGLSEMRRFRPIMNRFKRRLILNKYPPLARLFHCSSKNKFSEILTHLPETFKRLIREYIKRCFILHLHLRQIKEFKGLMARRQIILEVIDQPDLLKGNMNFANNLVKNFCKGVVNFVVLFHEELREEGFLPSSRKPSQAPLPEKES